MLKSERRACTVHVVTKDLDRFEVVVLQSEAQASHIRSAVLQEISDEPLQSWVYGNLDIAV